jgi:hypothetical protein
MTGLLLSALYVAYQYGANDAPINETILGVTPNLRVWYWVINVVLLLLALIMVMLAVIDNDKYDKAGPLGMFIGLKVLILTPLYVYGTYVLEAAAASGNYRRFVAAAVFFVIAWIVQRAKYPTKDKKEVN